MIIHSSDKKNAVNWDNVQRAYVEGKAIYYIMDTGEKVKMAEYDTEQEAEEKLNCMSVRIAKEYIGFA